MLTSQELLESMALVGIFITVLSTMIYVDNILIKKIPEGMVWQKKTLEFFNNINFALIFISVIMLAFQFLVFLNS